MCPRFRGGLGVFPPSPAIATGTTSIMTDFEMATSQISPQIFVPPTAP
jgi:hypothetical protein